MLGALDDSRRAQRQLVEDASHELRTPLTSLRTNIEVLASERELPPGERERLLSDVVEQLGEMRNLISELIELARGEQPAATSRTCASTSSRQKRSSARGGIVPASRSRRSSRSRSCTASL